MSVYAEAGAWLRNRRRAAEITAQELAEILLLDEADVVAAESGTIAILQGKLCGAARVFGMSPSQLEENYRAHLGLAKAAA